jgi:hypothetical protein
MASVPEVQCNWHLRADPVVLCMTRGTSGLILPACSRSLIVADTVSQLGDWLCSQGLLRVFRLVPGSI